ncbi:MAG: hypothetical protein ACI841_004570, partial [Planctomycetota bacterium]
LGAAVNAVEERRLALEPADCEPYQIRGRFRRLIRVERRRYSGNARMCSVTCVRGAGSVSTSPVASKPSRSYNPIAR